MLQKYSPQEHFQPEEAVNFLTPAFLLDVIKRRLFYFLIPAILVAVVGAVVVMMIPAVYSAEGKILVESQQIPQELVKSTVSAVANERIQVISQRILTRDNLLAIANKHQLFSGSRKQMTGTEMVDWMRTNAKIKPVDLRSNVRTTTLAFTVGFEHEIPQTAQRVAGELVTMILSEDVRVRTNFASETTKFLEREYKRLETELAQVETKIGDMKKEQARPAQNAGSDLQLNALKAELSQKAATYSDAHPDMKVIKQKIASLEKMMTTPKEIEMGMDALERQQAAITKNLENTGQKLTTARLGESLERGQQSERLEVIEQPALPQKPLRPNRPKFLALVAALALVAGGSLVFVLEALQSTIFRTADILRVADSHLVVTIPYISTEQELQGKRTRMILAIGLAVVLLLIGVVVALFFLPPLDVLFNGVLVMFGA